MDSKDHTRIGLAVYKAWDMCQFCSNDKEVIKLMFALLSEVLAQDNPEFDQSLFHKACFKGE